MDLNDTAADFKEIKIKRAKYTSDTKNKLSRNKKQKTGNEVVERGSQREKKRSQPSSKNEGVCSSGEVISKPTTSSYFCGGELIPCNKSSVSKDAPLYIGQNINSTKIILLPESSGNKTESYNLAAKTECNLPSAENAAIAKSDSPQSVASSDGTVYQQKSQESESTTTETSSKPDEESWWCIFCNDSLPAVGRDKHVKSCVLQFEYKTSGKKESCPEVIENQPSDFLCEVCKKDISHLSLQNRNEHINSCIDSQTRDHKLLLTSHDPAPEAQPESINISECPVCGKQYTSLETRLIHIKKCCKRHKMEPQQVIIALQLQEKHALERIAIGLPPLQIKPSSLKSNVNSRPRRRKVPLQIKSDPDLQIAMALSLSLKEEEKRKQESLGLLFDEPSGLALSEQGGGSGGKPSVELKPPSGNQMPGRTKPRNKKNDLNKPIPTLLLRTEEERLKLLQERVSSIIAPVSPPKEVPQKSAMLASEIPGVVTADRCSESSGNLCTSDDSMKVYELWTLSGLAQEKDTYYVAELQEWISLSEVVAGSKLRHLSQLPGHKISHDLGFEYSTFYTNDDQDLLSQNCATKSLVDIPSTQEMLDVITKDDTFASQETLDAHQKSELAPSHCSDLYFRGKLKNDGFFPELQKNGDHNIANPVIDCLRKLVGNSWMSDVNVIVAEQRSIPAHKLLLLLRCPAIGKEFQESHSGMSLLDWTSTSFRAAMEFLYFMYTGFCQLDCPLKMEICQLFYRYDMSEAYEALKNETGTPNEGRSSRYDDDMSSGNDTDADIFQGNHDVKSCDLVVEQGEALKCFDVHNVHPKSSNYENNFSSKDTSLISNRETESLVMSFKNNSPATSPADWHRSQRAKSPNHDIEILKEEVNYPGFLSITKSTNFSSQTSFKNTALSKPAVGSSLEENFEVPIQRSQHSPKDQSSLICDEDIKFPCSPSKGKCLSQLQVSPSDQNVYSPDRNNELSVSFEGKKNSTKILGHPINGLSSPILFKNRPTVHDNDLIFGISPLKQDVSSIEGEKSSAYKFHETEDKKLPAKNHGSGNFNATDLRSSNSLLGASHSDCSFSHKAGGENSPELFVCDSDEEVYAVCSSNNISSNFRGAGGVPHSASSAEETLSPHISKVGAVFSLKSVCRSPDQEIVFVNNVSSKNHGMSASCVLKSPNLSALTKSESGYPNKNSHKGIHNSPIKEVGGGYDNEYLPDLVLNNTHIRGSQVLLASPTSSRSSSSFMSQKRKLPKSMSPILLNEMDASFKKVKVDVQKQDTSDICSPFNTDGKQHATVGKNTVVDSRDVLMNKTFGQLHMLNTVDKSAQSVLSNSKSFPGLCTNNDDDSEVELEAICATDQNDLSDVWEGFDDDDGFREDFVIYGSYNTTVNNNLQFTPLKSSRNRPPTPHPSSARKSAKKLSFLDEDVNPASSPVPTPLNQVDLNLSPITMQPLGERLGIQNQWKKSCNIKTTQKVVPDLSFQHQENTLDSRKEIHLAPHVVTPEIKKTVKSKKLENCTITTSAITPMPDFKKMVTPELKDRLQKYGVRALPRKKAVSLLTHIYDETHPWQVETELNCKSKKPVCITVSPAKLPPEKLKHCKKASALPSPQKAKECEKQKASKASKPSSRKEKKKTSNCKTAKETHLKNDPQQNNDEEDELNVSSSQTSSFSESSDFPEESILKTDEDEDDELITASQCKSLEERISNYILSDQHLYTKILMYEPVNLSDFQQQLKQHGIKVGQTKVMEYLDDKCITFTLPRSEKHQKKQQERNKRFRARVLGKLSQKPMSQKS